MANALVSLSKVNKIYGDKVKTHVLFDIYLEIAESKFVAIIGPSGSGKSTLLNILGALDRPTDGKIIINGQDLSLLNENQLADFRNEVMGFIFQFHYLLPEFTALENVLIPFLIRRGRADQETTARALELLEKLGLGEQVKKPINQLSGGQQQRVAIARALINKPRLILADEPTGSLDTKSGGAVLELLRQINVENRTTFLVVTHDRTVAAKADQIIELVDGRIFRSYLPEELGSTQTWYDGLNAYACSVDE